MQEALTYDDIIFPPRYSEILPGEAKIESHFSRNIPLKIPIASSPMDTVTEHQMAIALALLGGIGIIHKNLTIEKQAGEVQLVKRFQNGFVLDPVTTSLNNTIDDLHRIGEEEGYRKIPVVDKEGKLVGLVTECDYFWPDDKGKSVKNIMVPAKELITLNSGSSLSEANAVIRAKKLSVLCVVDKKGKLISIVTRKDLEKNQDFPHANKDQNKRLRVGAAVGPGKDFSKRALMLVQSGVDVIVIDTAHGHSKNVIDAVKMLKKDKTFKSVDIVAGNVATQEGAQALAAAGADGIKVGVGAGSICTTRVIAGIGMPQASAIMEAVKAKVKNNNVPIIADGGIKYSGDIVKALALGADCVMLGGLLAGTEEAPGEMEYVDGLMYKTYRGMGSVGAMKLGSKDRYGQSGINDSQKFVPEGIEGRVIYRGPVEKIIYQLIGGLRSGLGYLGARNLKELQKKAKPVKITNAGLTENHPHDVIITKDAPNYQRK